MWAVPAWGGIAAPVQSLGSFVWDVHAPGGRDGREHPAAPGEYELAVTSTYDHDADRLGDQLAGRGVQHGHAVRKVGVISPRRDQPGRLVPA